MGGEPDGDAAAGVSRDSVPHNCDEGEENASTPSSGETLALPLGKGQRAFGPLAYDVRRFAFDANVGAMRIAAQESGCHSRPRNAPVRRAVHRSIMAGTSPSFGLMSTTIRHGM